MASPREEIANRIAAFIRQENLCNPYGGDVTLSADRRSRSVAFSKPANLDGHVDIYSPNFILISYRTRYHGLPHTDRRIFATEKDAVEFLRLAFVEYKFDEALDIPTKGK